VVIYGALADIQAGGDIFVGETISDRGNNFQLSIGEVRRQLRFCFTHGKDTGIYTYVYTLDCIGKKFHPPLCSSSRYVDMSTIICLGEVLFDLLADQVGVSSDQVTSWTALAGGAPANVACAVVKMGDQAKFIGCVGNDQPGLELTNKLQSIGVNVSGVQRHPTAPTRQVQVVRSLDGDRSFGGFGGIGGIPSAEFADAQLSEVATELFKEADFLQLGTLALAYPASATSTWRSVELAQAQGIKILVDVNWRPSFWPDPSAALAPIRQLLVKADFVKFAKEEAELIYGEALPLNLRQHLPQAEGIIVTDGGNICEYWLQGEVGQQPAFAVKAVDTTGAGDAFVAGLLHQLGAGKSPTETVRYAAAAGALTTLRPGAIDAQPTDGEILNFLADQNF
jgi:fructokinase